MPQIYSYRDLLDIADSLRNELSPYICQSEVSYGNIVNSEKKDINFILIFAHNGVGKTRLSTWFKNGNNLKHNLDTLYYNAFTEDLFFWDNDLTSDINLKLLINKESKFVKSLEDNHFIENIRKYFRKYVSNIDFIIDTSEWTVSFKHSITTEYEPKTKSYGINISCVSTTENCSKIKISRGEEHLFIWSFFLATCERVVSGHADYLWVKYIYVDDPISSLDDNNVTLIASDLSAMLKKGSKNYKAIISTHHTLFYNIICNKLRKKNCRCYYLEYLKSTRMYTLQVIEDIPFCYHILLLKELDNLANSDEHVTPYHFNMLRSLLEKIATFHGYSDFFECIKDECGEKLSHMRTCISNKNHGGHTIFESPFVENSQKEDFIKIINIIKSKFNFNPKILK